MRNRAIEKGFGSGVPEMGNDGKTMGSDGKRRETMGSDEKRWETMGKGKRKRRVSLTVVTSLHVVTLRYTSLHFVAVTSSSSSSLTSSSSSSCLLFLRLP